MALPFRYNALSLLARPTSTLSSVALVALVIAVFCYLQAVTDSAFNAMESAGDPRTVIVLSQQADTESVSGVGKDELNKLDMTPGAERDASGTVISPELVAISSAMTAEEDGVAVNAAVRGVDFDKAKQVRRGAVRIIEGRPFQAGTYEVIVGDQARKLYRHHNLGDEIELGSRGVRKFKVVGVFTTGGSAVDSEVWGYVETLRDMYNRQGYSSARMLAPDEETARKMVEFLRGPSVALGAKTESEYFKSLQTNQTATQVLSISMIILMGIAAAFAVANTMYSAVAGRTREIGMLRAIGFSGTSVLTAFVIEGILLSAIGGALGCLMSLFWNGAQRAVLPSTFTTMAYSLRITSSIMTVSFIVAIAIGLLGSIMPAWRAARLNVIQSLREA